MGQALFLLSIALPIALGVLASVVGLFQPKSLGAKLAWSAIFVLVGILASVVVFWQQNVQRQEDLSAKYNVAASIIHQTSGTYHICLVNNGDLSIYFFGLYFDPPVGSLINAPAPSQDDQRVIPRGTTYCVDTNFDAAVLQDYPGTQSPRIRGRVLLKNQIGDKFVAIFVVTPHIKNGVMGSVDTQMLDISRSEW